jgi:hypothetical protein
MDGFSSFFGGLVIDHNRGNPRGAECFDGTFWSFSANVDAVIYYAA